MNSCVCVCVYINMTIWGKRLKREPENCWGKAGLIQWDLFRCSGVTRHWWKSNQSWDSKHEQQDSSEDRTLLFSPRKVVIKIRSFKYLLLIACWFHKYTLPFIGTKVIGKKLCCSAKLLLVLHHPQARRQCRVVLKMILGQTKKMKELFLSALLQ